MSMRRQRNAKIIATLGPASSSPEMIQKLFMAGADVFRLNFSHGLHEEHRRRLEIIRTLEALTGRPVGVVLDLQGPKLRVGEFRGGRVSLTAGQAFRLDLEHEPGDTTRAPLPHPEIFAALRAGTDLLLDDGKVRLKVVRATSQYADTIVKTAGDISDHKGVNVPDVVLPLSPISEKDQTDLDLGLEIGVDWVAGSFIQDADGVRDLQERVNGRAKVMSKLEKPSAIEHLQEIIELSDGLMVARGDLGVELPPEQLPSLQKRIIRECRTSGKPVIVATQMLESMISSPIPTRAEASDVATAIYDGADAVMLSAETAVGSYPEEAVTMMDRTIMRVERDPHYRTMMDAQTPPPKPDPADAICDALRRISHTLPVAATVTFTSSGSTSLRAARERPEAPILSLTPNLSTARMLALVWGVHSVPTEDVHHVTDMVNSACQIALRDGFAVDGEALVIAAGMPFGVAGTTNLLRIAYVDERAIS
jgi:pyruvate kinase